MSLVRFDRSPDGAIVGQDKSLALFLSERREINRPRPDLGLPEEFAGGKDVKRAVGPDPHPPPAARGGGGGQAVLVVFRLREEFPDLLERDGLAGAPKGQR